MPGLLDMLRQDFDPGELTPNDMLRDVQGTASDQEFLASANLVEDPSYVDPQTIAVGREDGQEAMGMGMAMSDDLGELEMAPEGTSELDDDYVESMRQELLEKAKQRAQASMHVQFKRNSNASR